MSTRNCTRFLDELDRRIENQHLLKHPFYRAWTEGRLSREQLVLYAEQYYQHVQAFPKNLDRLAARSEGNLRKVVAENLAEELDPANPHPLLWRRFATAVGAPQDQLDSVRPLPGVAALLDTYRHLAESGSHAEAVAAFYAYEAQVPEIASEKIAGLRRFYGIRDPQVLLYFSVHEEADIRHRAAWRAWLSAQRDENAAPALAAAERALRALWGALDAVYPAGCENNRAVRPGEPVAVTRNTVKGNP